MKIGSGNFTYGKSKKWAALGVFTLLLLTAVAYAEHRNWKWWKRGPVPAIENVVFDQGSARNGRVRNIIVANNQIRLRQKLSLKNTSFTAAVLNGVIAFGDISQERGVVSVDVTLDPATLQRNVFNSTFASSGEAVIVTDDANVTVPVTIFGAITQHQGVYTLKAQIRGLAGINTPIGRVVRIDLLAQEDIPTP